MKFARGGVYYTYIIKLLLLENSLGGFSFPSEWVGLWVGRIGRLDKTYVEW